MAIAVNWPLPSASNDLLGDGGHGDPCTPILGAYEGERVAIRLVQGAQEVQHVFTIEGLGWPRLQHWSAGRADG